MMEKIQAWIEKHLVPVVNKITSNFWFGIVAEEIPVHDFRMAA